MQEMGCREGGKRRRETLPETLGIANILNVLQALTLDLKN